jgi:hypothetical protein
MSNRVSSTVNLHQYGLPLVAPRTVDVLKERARLAFLAYESARLANDVELTEAARQRFVTASALLRKRR